MGQKIHPIGFRLGISKNHRSKWFASSPIYSNLISEDYFIRNLLFKQFTNGFISEIYIYRKFDDQIQLALYCSRPSLVLSYYKNDLKNLSDSVTQKIQKNRRLNLQSVFNTDLGLQSIYSLKPKVTVQIFELPKPDENANFIANSLVLELQKRVAFRRAMKKILRRVQRAKVQGVKVQISGRLNGAEIARTEWAREGKIPLQTLKADIDYCHKIANTIYGILGVKVWVYKK